jgi:hypothetical protein
MAENWEEIQTVNALCTDGFSHPSKCEVKISNFAFKVTVINSSKKERIYQILNNDGDVIATKRCWPNKQIEFTLRGVKSIHFKLLTQEVR